MSATLTLDLFRPSILDPVDERAARVDRRGTAGDHSSRHRPAAPDDQGQAQHRSSETGGGLTLDDLVVGVWEGLSSHRTVACPACGEAMAPRYGAGSAPVGGRCTACRTTIA